MDFHGRPMTPKDDRLRALFNSPGFLINITIRFRAP
jgi:hypothetical protein